MHGGVCQTVNNIVRVLSHIRSPWIRGNVIRDILPDQEAVDPQTVGNVESREQLNRISRIMYGISRTDIIPRSQTNAILARYFGRDPQPNLDQNNNHDESARA